MWFYCKRISLSLTPLSKSGYGHIVLFFGSTFSYFWLLLHNSSKLTNIVYRCWNLKSKHTTFTLTHFKMGTISVVPLVPLIAILNTPTSPLCSKLCEEFDIVRVTRYRIPETEFTNYLCNAPFWNWRFKFNKATSAALGFVLQFSRMHYRNTKCNNLKFFNRYNLPQYGSPLLVIVNNGFNFCFELLVRKFSFS